MLRVSLKVRVFVEALLWVRSKLTVGPIPEDDIVQLVVSLAVHVLVLELRREFES